MSKIGKINISIPEKVKVALSGNVLNVEGPLGKKSLKKIIMNKNLSLNERFKAQQKLSKLPRNSAKTRVMNRCQITGRPHEFIEN